MFNLYPRRIAFAIAAITAAMFMVFASGCTAGAPTMDSTSIGASHNDVATTPAAFVGPRATSEIWYTGLDSISFRMLRGDLATDLANHPGATNHDLWLYFQTCDDAAGTNAAYLPWSAAYDLLTLDQLADRLYDKVESSGDPYVRWDNGL